MAEFMTEGATMAEPSAFNNLTSLLSAGASHWKSAMNISQLAPSAKDLILAGPRIGIKIGSFLFGMPEMVDNASDSAGIAGVAQAGISEAFSGVSSANDLTRGVADVGAGIINDTAGRDYGFASRVSVESARSFGNIFSYSTSRWALLCVTMAIALNRTQVYASTRRSITLGWKIRSALRLIPILLLAFQARSLLQSIQCQTSPDFAMLRWGNASKSSDLMFTQDGGFLHSISSNILFNPPDEASCLAVKMIPSEDDDSDGPLDLVGSLSRLWPMFQTLCLSQFIETISCAVQGRQVASETGMTLFEHSLAFAEAEAAVSSSLGWGPFGEKRPDRESTPTTTDSNMSELVIKRTMIMKRVNTPPEVLLVGFMSAMNHITSHMLGIFNLQGKLRLASTAFWGICFISTIAYSVINFSIDDLASQALLRFPTVCIVGFIPHILILAGLVLCSAIYGLALLLIALAPPPGSPEQQTFLEKLSSAHNNMQASVSLSNIRINMHMDFYQALLKTGYNALTMASEAVYLNESSEVNIKQRTWLEEQRLQEIEDSGAAWLGPSFRNSQQDHPNDVGLVIIPDESSQLRNSTSGFARERAGRPGGKSKSEKAIRNGIGASERSGRWIMAFEFFVGIVHLVGFWFAALTLKLLSSVGIRTRPRWLTWLSSRPKVGTKDKTGPVEQPSENINFYVLGEDGVPRLPSDENVDVEAEMRRALSASGNNRLTHVDEKDLEDELYGWWLNGGWWGAEDNSGQFVPPILDADEDNTSMISAIDARERNWESEDEEEGQRTPTRSSPQFSREVTPVFDSPLYLDDLARLLHPKTPEERSEAQALAAHMASDTILTRSRFNTLSQSARTKMLTSTRSGIHPLQNGAFGKQSPEEEAAILECLINSRREARTAGRPDTSWAEGAAGMGDGGPQCVVCQSAPRSIIVWPCRCLSLCDDCRVSLAMNNFDKCVCCRRDVSSFSRIFVP